VGTISVITGSNVVTGDGSAFESDMAGALLLIGRDGTNLPTGRYGLNRFAEQRRIHSVSTLTELALTENVSVSRSAVKYVVTDPIDIEPCARNAFLRYMELHLMVSHNVGATADRFSPIKQFVDLAEKALREAMAQSYPTRYDPAQDSGHGFGLSYPGNVPASTWEEL
jgi:hypothetical protein